MSLGSPILPDLAPRVAAAVDAARVTYGDVARELVRLRDASAIERVTGVAGLGRVSRELGVELTIMIRTIEQLGAGRRAPGADDPQVALPLLRAIAESLVMLSAPSWEALIARPIAGPREIERLAAAPALARFLARHAPRSG